MQIEAFLCDAATVRENLLHVLGGGITRVWRPSFPAPLGAQLAVMLTMAPSEAQEKHRIRILVLTEDGGRVGEIKGEFQVSPGPDVKPGERISLPVVMDLRPLEIKREGTYSIELLIDGQLQRSFSFVASLQDIRTPG